MCASINFNQIQCLNTIHKSSAMGVISVLFLIFFFIIIQVTNQVEIQKSWIHNTKLLCVKQNASYVANSTCNLVLVSRNTELNNINIVLQPNVVLHNLHVTTYLVKHLYDPFLVLPILIIKICFRYNFQLTTDLQVFNIAQFWWTIEWIFAKLLQQRNSYWLQ